MKTLSILLSASLFASVAYAGKDCDGCHCSSKCDSKTSRAATLTQAAPSDVYFVINDMTCGGCVSKVSTTLAKVDGASDIKLDAKTRSAAMNFDAEKITKAQLVEAINSSGFKVTGERVKMNVSGMDCVSCEKKLTTKLQEVDGLQSVKAVSAKEGFVEVIVDPTTDASNITKAIEALGYKVS